MCVCVTPEAKRAATHGNRIAQDKACRPTSPPECKPVPVVPQEKPKHQSEQAQKEKTKPTTTKKKEDSLVCEICGATETTRKQPFTETSLMHHKNRKHTGWEKE